MSLAGMTPGLAISSNFNVKIMPTTQQTQQQWFHLVQL